MKKSTVKKDKLMLNRETLRSLEETQLELIVGGVTWGCQTRNTCTTNLC